MSGTFVATAAWGLLILAAFVGWGGEIGAWLFGRPHADAGLRAVWGMSLAILAGGLACLFLIASKGMVFAFVAAGIVLGCVRWLRDRERTRFDFGVRIAYWKEYPGSSLLLLLCAAAALLQYLGSIWNLRFNPNDDFIAYFPFAKQILQQGTLFDTFSTRRAMSFGGQSFLHAMVLAGAPGFRLHMFDQGICLLIAGLLVVGDRRDGDPLWPSRLALLLLLTFPDIRANTYPEMSGVVVFYGLYRTLTRLEERRPESGALAGAILVALVASAACTLRSNYIAVCVPMVALSYAHLVWKAGADRGQRLRETLYAAALSAAFLVPWMVLSYRSSGTPLFPILKGHFNDAFPMLQSPGNWQQQLTDLIDTVKENRLMRSFPLLFVAGLLLPDRAKRKALQSLLLAGFIGWVLLVHTLASDAPSFERYVYGFLVASALAVTTRIGIEVGECSPARRMMFRIARALGAIGVLAQLSMVGADAIGNLQQTMHKLAVLRIIPIRSPDQSPAAEGYRALQARVPPGEPLLVMVDRPYLFDFARNDIFNVDTAAAISPPPGMPYFRGPEAVADYLRGQSIRYLAFILPQRALSLYRKDVWERQRIEPHALWRAQAPVYLDMFASFAKLAASRKRVYDDGTLVLLDLSQRASRRYLMKSTGKSISTGHPIAGEPECQPNCDRSDDNVYPGRRPWVTEFGCRCRHQTDAQRCADLAHGDAAGVRFRISFKQEYRGTQSEQ